jgi:hypothetical protein
MDLTTVEGLVDHVVKGMKLIETEGSRKAVQMVNNGVS